MQAFDYLKELAKEHRYGGTAEERRAQKKITRWFQELGYEVEREATEYISSTVYLILKWMLAFVVFIALLVSSLWINTFIVALAILGFYAFLFKVMPKIELKIAKTKSENIIATLNPEKKHRLILCGHYDSARVVPKWFTKYQEIRGAITPILTMISPIGLLVVLILHGLYYPLDIFTGFQGYWVYIWWFFLVFSLVNYVPLLIMIFYMTDILGSDYSLGADDNASGIAAMLDVSKRIKGSELNMRVDFCCFAAEESGLFGSRGWVEKHRDEIDMERTYILNLDMVGRGDVYFLTNGVGMIPKKHCDTELLKTLKDSLEKNHQEYEEMWGGATDVQEFLNKKMRAVSLMRANTKKMNVGHKMMNLIFRTPVHSDFYPDISRWHHTEDDTTDKVSPNKLESSVLVVETFIHSISSKIDEI
ncbi:MAG: M28 family peptidase [Thermoplasmata archaeon]